MPSGFFDMDVFSDIIMSVHADKEQVFFVTRAGGNEYLLPDAIFNESFRLYQTDSQGIPQEAMVAAVTCRKSDLPYSDPMDHFLRRGSQRWAIVGSQPDGIGKVLLILDERH